MPISRLSRRSVLSVKGQDAEAFLQGLVTNDMTRLHDQPALYAGLLTPQGKVIADFHIVADGNNGYLFDVDASQAGTLLSRLKMYRLRSKVDLADLSASHAVAAIWGDAHVTAMPPSARLFVDARASGLGSRMIVELDDAPANSGEAAYEEFATRLGVPSSLDVEGEFALDANFEELGGVDFRKGCFVGQEVTARMKHKAQPRKRLVPFALSREVALAGSKLADEAGTPIGEIKTVTAQSGIATVRVDRLLDGMRLRVDGVDITLLPTAYPMPALKSGISIP